MRCACPPGTMCAGKNCRAAIDTSFRNPAIHAFSLPPDDAACVPIPNYSEAAEIVERARRAKINRLIYTEGARLPLCLQSVCASVCAVSDLCGLWPRPCVGTHPTLVSLQPLGHTEISFHGDAWLIATPPHA